MTNPLRVVIRGFDGWLSQVEGVECFSDDPQVIIRLQPTHTTHDIELPEGFIPKGTRVLLVHMWNERAPQIPADGADLAYGLRLHRLLVSSWRALAIHIQSRPEMEDIQALGAISALFLMGADGGASAMRGYGFTQVPYRRQGGGFGEFWENFYSWWVMWAYNPVSAKSHRMLDLQRTEFWITREHFLEKYGSSQKKCNGPEVHKDEAIVGPGSVG